MADDYSPQALLDQVNKALKAIMIGGQSYRIGDRELTRANITELRKLRDELSAEISADNSSSLFANTHAVFFEGPR